MFSTLRARLVLLALAVLAPALVAGGVLLWSAYAHERAAVERRIGDQARALGLVVDRQLGQSRVQLHTLAVTSAFMDADWEAFDALARRAIPDPNSWVVVSADDGRQLVNTRLPRGAPPLRANAQTLGITWAGVEGDGTRISNLFRAPGSGRPLVAANRVVRLRTGERVRISVAIDARAFDSIWRERALPPGWLGTVLDAQGVIVARSRRSREFIGRSAAPSVQAKLDATPEGRAETRTLDGVVSVTAWSRSQGSGWTFVLAAPRAEVVGTARESLVLGTLVGVVLMAGGVTLALVMARHIAAPVEALTTAAGRWEAGEEPALTPCGVSEVDTLGAALARAAGRLAAKQAELQELNASLEARVAERSRELEATNESLVQAQKLEAIGRLTGGVAHDFNNLLMAVTGNLDLLKRRLKDERLERYVVQARQAAERGARLTSQLLAFSRKQRLQPRTLDINQAIDQARELLHGALGGAVQVETRLAPDLWPAVADATQLELVILNLVINARDAMPPKGGLVTIATRNEVRVQPSYRPESPPSGEFVVISVCDTGAGMAPEVVARVFEPFFTTKDVGQGSGLGLPQVLGLAKQLGGGVEIDTAPGQGTTVEVFLPRANSPAPQSEARGEDVAPDLAGVKVLLVDDDPDVRKVTLAILKDLGCEAVEAASGGAALKIAGDGRRFDIALLDFAMPGMDGAETAERLRSILPGLPVLMMSGYADVEALAGRWQGGMLHKPFGAVALAIQIAEATASVSRRMEPSVK